MGDEVVVTKAGKFSHGLERFFASLYGTPVPGVAYATLARVRVQAQHSLPMRVEQVMRSEAEKAVSMAKAASEKSNAWETSRRPRRPKGSKNKPKTDGTFTPELLRRTG